MYEHMDALIARYGGRVATWDVVNEAIDDKAGEGAFGYRQTLWYKIIGPDFIELAFRHAREKLPNAKLFYNDYNSELTDSEVSQHKGDRVYQMIKDLKSRGVPIDGVGLQGHFYISFDGTAGDGAPNMDSVKANFRRYAELNLEVQVTEADFRIAKPLDDNKLQIQTKFYKDFLQTCIDAPNCTLFTVWGVSDLDSWVPSTFPDADYAHVWDRDFKPRPSYAAMIEDFSKYNLSDGTPIANAHSKTGCEMGSSATSGTKSFGAAFGLLGLVALLRRGGRRGQ
jgi:endo-1,4-beta-xylanase